MSRTGLLRRAPFRVALLCTCLFAIACLVGATIATSLVASSLHARLDALVEERWTSVASEHGAGDATAFVELVGAQARIADPRRSLYRLEDATGRALIGADLPFERRGLFSVTLDGAGYRVLGTGIGELTLWTGIDEEETDIVVALVRESLARALGASLLLVLGVGLLLAHRSGRRLAALDRALVAIADGRLDTRLPLSARGDEIDAIAAGFNRTVIELQNSLVALEQSGSDIAHDLKTPIARLGAALEQALDRDDRGERVTSALVTARGDVDGLARIVDALLRIARLERGEREGEFAPIDPAALLDTLIEDYAPLAEDAGIALERGADLPAAGPRARIAGDAGLLVQLCVNLIENALRHCPAGSTVTARTVTAADRLDIEFDDDGPGIPVSEHDRVFRRLYRLERSRSTPGNGLGLAMAAAIVRLHRGRITLTDRDPGLSVRVSLPRPPAAGTPAARTGPGTRSAPGPHRSPA